MVKVECFFDCSSPWAYLGFSNLLRLSARLGIAVDWRPVVVGFVFAQVNQDIYVSRRMRAPVLKGSYEQKEMQGWADDAGIILRVPPKCGHPVNSIKAMRGCIALRAAGKLVPFAIACYEALWRDGRNIGDEAVLTDICRQIGVEPEHFFAAIAGDEPKAELKRNADELARRGGFGVPTFCIDDEVMLWGTNRMRLVEHQMRMRLRLPAAEPVDA